MWASLRSSMKKYDSVVITWRKRQPTLSSLVLGCCGAFVFTFLFLALIGLLPNELIYRLFALFVSYYFAMRFFLLFAIDFFIK